MNILTPENASASAGLLAIMSMQIFFFYWEAQIDTWEKWQTYERHLLTMNLLIILLMSWQAH
jgi:hypothetical protein